MNKARRKKIDEAIEQVNQLYDILQELQGSIEEIRDEEQEYFGNIPENLQGSERYENAENAIGVLENAIDWIDSIDTEELTSFLEEAKGN